MSPKNSLEPDSGIFLQQDELAPELPPLPEVTCWIEGILASESRALMALYFVFVTDDVLLEINQEYLGHDTYTDIITFPYHDDPVEGEIYISVDRVRENADRFGASPREEFLRVMAHGVLHLCGWDDHSDQSRQLMRRREDACLAQFGIIPEGYPVSPS